MDTSGVTTCSDVLLRSAFDQDIGAWDTSGAAMDYMSVCLGLRPARRVGHPGYDDVRLFDWERLRPGPRLVVATA